MAFCPGLASDSGLFLIVCARRKGMYDFMTLYTGPVLLSP